MGSRAICVSRDAGVRQAVGEALARHGVPCDHHDTLPSQTADVALLVVDRETREAAGEALRDAPAPVVVVGDSLDDDALFSLMTEAPVSHLVGDPTTPELGVTSEKLVSRDLFGLEKYLARGATVGQREVHDEAGKRAAIAEICSWAEGAGARRPLIHRLASVADELLMNAMIDAPRESQPSLAYDPNAPHHRALLRWGADSANLAISVDDRFGAIRQRDVIEHVRRARADRGRPNLGDPGAGLGLYLVLANVSSLVVNLDPGRRTEVIALFELGRRRKRNTSLHVFSA
jgi:hypothetical protein